NTYPADHVHKLLEPIVLGDADMVVGGRLANHTDKSFRPLHLFGNRLVCALVNWIGRSRLSDIMSGYRAFNRNVIKRIPVVSSGFEAETDLTLQILYYNLKILETNVPYRERPAGSQSKLRTFRDGFSVLWRIFSLLRSFKPLTYDPSKPNRKLVNYYRDKMNTLGYCTNILITQVVGCENEILPHKDAIVPGLDYSDASLSYLKEVRRHLVNGFKDMPDEELIVAGIFL